MYLPESVIETQITVFTGWDGIGNNTKKAQQARNNKGIIILVLIGLGISGCLYLNHNIPAILAATDSHKI